MIAVLAAAAALVVALRATYPRLLERAHGRRLPTGPDGVILGAEDIDLRRENAPAVLLLHGGGDTPQSLRELATYLYARGFAVRGPLLRGHGRALSEVRQFAAAPWRAQVRDEFDALRARYEWVGIVGISVGGALALGLAAERDDVGALVLLAPYVAMPRAIRAMARFGALWGPFIPYLPSLGSRSIHDPRARAAALGHAVITPAALKALRAVADEADVSLARVTAPTLTIQSREDNRVSPRAAERAFARLAARDKRFVWLEDTGHVITVDFGKERVFDLCSDWLVRHSRR